MLFHQLKRFFSGSVFVLLDCHGTLGNMGRFKNPTAVNVGDKSSDIVISRMVNDFLRRSHLNECPVLHDGDLVAQKQCFVEVVRDEDDCLVQNFLQVKKLFLHFPTNQGIESTERLVHQENLGIGRKAARQADALLHAAGQFVRHAVRISGQAHLLQRCKCPLASLFFFALDLQSIRNVFGDGFVGKQGEMLKDHRDLVTPNIPQLICRTTGDIFIINQNSSRSRRDQSIEHSHQCRLAGARQPHDDEDFSLVHLETDALNADSLAGFF